MLDTRTKLLTLEQAAALPAPGLLVTGYFDPLLSAQAARLAELANQAPLLVLVGDPPQPLLPVQARAELVAALRSVTHVVPLPPELSFEDALARFPNASVAREEAFDLQHRASLLVRIRNRHPAAVTP